MLGIHGSIMIGTIVRNSNICNSWNVFGQEVATIDAAQLKTAAGGGIYVTEDLLSLNDSCYSLKQFHDSIQQT